MQSLPMGIERIEVYKTLSADQDADGIGGTVNIVTPTAQERPTYSLNGTAGYNPLQNGYWRGGFDGTFGRQGSASVAHNYTVYGHPSTFSMGIKIRNSSSSQFENTYNSNNVGGFTFADVLGTYTNPTYYNGSFAIGGMAYGPTSSYSKIQQAVTANSSGSTLDPVAAAQAFFNANERISAGYLEDVIFFGNFRQQAGVRFDNGGTSFLANQIAFDANGNPTITPIRQNASYFNALPSVSLQYQVQKDTNLRVVYGRGLARPNIGDLVPATVIDPNQTPYPTVSTGNPNLSTAGNSADGLVLQAALRPDLSDSHAHPQLQRNRHDLPADPVDQRTRRTYPRV
jgi:outer membrane receptor protein involved in Fe transport